MSFVRNSILCSVAIFFITLQPVLPQNFTPYEEIWKKSQTYRPQLSFDVTPILVKIVAVTYRIPRNYLVYLEPAVPTLKVTFPGFKPLTEETRKCFDPKLQGDALGCTTFEFRLAGSTGPGPGGLALTNREMFENFVKGFENIKPRRGTFGYDVYDVGPEDARTETYRKEDGDIYFHCFVNLKIDRGKDGVCDDSVLLKDKNHAMFFFRRSQIGSVPELEGGIRRLMEGFRISEVDSRNL